MKQTFYSNGKLLITGEYAVLDGALALALPTKFGQDLVVAVGENKCLEWKSYDSDKKIWFEDVITFEEIIIQTATNNPIKATLLKILHEASLANPNFLQSDGFVISAHLTFPRSWGLGTSSTLINNIAQWLKIDAYELLKNSFGGSGYDIACAQHNTPLCYRLTQGKPNVTPVAFHPDFTKQLYFVYLNTKQSSKTAIASYNSKKKNANVFVPLIDSLTQAVLKTREVQHFASLLEEHETVMSGILEIDKVKDILFSDFNGTVKSLGAWGGDFVLVVSDRNPTPYFESKGFKIVIPYEKMILS